LASTFISLRAERQAGRPLFPAATAGQPDEFARDTLDMSVRTALSTSDIRSDPIQRRNPRAHSDFGVVRRWMSRTHRHGEARPAEWAHGGLRFDCHAAAFSEKSPTVTFASLESHKIGGIVRLRVRSTSKRGRQWAVSCPLRASSSPGWRITGDSCGWSGAYESVKGVVQIAREIRRPLSSLRRRRNERRDAGRLPHVARRSTKRFERSRLALLLDSTGRRSSPPSNDCRANVYQRLPDGSAVLDGLSDCLDRCAQPYGQARAGHVDCRFWRDVVLVDGRTRSPRIDTSEHVWFATISWRCGSSRRSTSISGGGCTAALITAASCPLGCRGGKARHCLVCACAMLTQLATVKAPWTPSSDTRTMTCSRGHRGCEREVRRELNRTCADGWRHAGVFRDGYGDRCALLPIEAVSKFD